MNPQEKEQLIKGIFSDEEYVKSLAALETPEEVQASLKEKGLEITVEEIMQIKNLLPRIQDGELSDEELESVSGGIALETIIVGTIIALAGGALLTGMIAPKLRW